MCCKLKKMKRLFIARFNRKPVTKRISCILCWSIGLITAALLLSGQFLCAFAFVTLIALAYLAIVLACKKIEELNILQAAMLAMTRAVSGLQIPVQCALIDGNRLPRMNLPMQAVIHGDATSASIAAASVLAKVARDRYMLALDQQYPEYGFAKHKGYGTKAHYEALRTFGISPVHRRSFLKNLT